jgi:hypothetical protein
LDLSLTGDDILPSIISNDIYDLVDVVDDALDDGGSLVVLEIEEEFSGFLFEGEELGCWDQVRGDEESEPVLGFAGFLEGFGGSGWSFDGRGEDWHGKTRILAILPAIPRIGLARVVLELHQVASGVIE